jgi:hypothetical protein
MTVGAKEDKYDKYVETVNASIAVDRIHQYPWFFEKKILENLGFWVWV